MTRALVVALLSAAALFDGPSPVIGRVVADETGDAVPNARVRIAAAGRSAVLAVTDDEGRFTIAQPSWPATITAFKSGYVSRAILVRAAQPSIEVRLARAAVISGRVVNELGDPIVDARVAAEAPGQAKRAPPLAATETDDAGEFRLGGLAAGSFVVSVVTNSNAGRRIVEQFGVRYSSATTQTYYPAAASAAEAETIALAAGEERANVDLVVAADQIGGISYEIGGARPRTATAPRPDATGAIAGRVSTPDGRPLPHAVVRLLGASAPVPDQSTTSDADGRYDFDGIAGGRYRIAAAKSGYAPPTRSDIVIMGLPMFGAGPSVTLGEDEKREDVDITLARLGSVSGFVFDERGDPIQGATVQVLRVRFERGRRRLVPADTARRTDDRGYYRIFDVEPGQYLVSASVGAMMMFAGAPTDLPGYATTYFPGSAEPRGARLVDVATSQDVTAIDFSLTPTKTALVSGTILNAAGAPSAAGTLQLRPLVGASVAPAPMNATTHPDGTFEFANVPSGPYVIYADRGRQNPSVEGEFAAVPVTVSGDDLPGLTVQMSAGSSIAGRITFDTVDPDTRPNAERVEISPIPLDPDVSPGTPARANIARDWTFEMRGVNGVRRLLAPQLPPGWALRDVRVNGVDATDRPIAFGRRDQSLSDVEVVLTDRVARVDGAVTDGDGHPVAGASIVAFAIDRDRRYPWSRFVQHTTAAADGTFVLAGVPAASYYVAAVTLLPVDGDDAWQDAAFQESLVASATTITVGEGERRTLALRVSAR
ncbi:MAG TPA: carboxypeptidase-like regulatory domain-containing protein [Vicinamibacterales bacterium]|nr:carboxypeptidase-like regulatory domain-containing protein [Vicinamibacterales bacterium]